MNTTNTTEMRGEKTMKNFTIIAHNITTGTALVMTSIKAKSTKDARKYAMQNYWQYLEANEQLVVATDSQYEEYWRAKVEKLDNLLIDTM